MAHFWRTCGKKDSDPIWLIILTIDSDRIWLLKKKSSITMTITQSKCLNLGNQFFTKSIDRWFCPKYVLLVVILVGLLINFVFFFLNWKRDNQNLKTMMTFGTAEWAGFHPRKRNKLKSAWKIMILTYKIDLSLNRNVWHNITNLFKIIFTSKYCVPTLVSRKRVTYTFIFFGKFSSPYSSN